MHLTDLDPEWVKILTDHIHSAQPDAYGNCDNIAVVRASWVALLGDCYGRKKPDKVLRRFFKKLCKDLYGTMAAGAELSKLLRASVRVRDDGTFEKLYVKEFERWPIYREYKQWYDTDDDRLWQYLLTFLEWGRKAEYIDPSLETASVQRWKAIENDLCRIDPPMNLLEDLRFILSFLPDPDFSEISFKFGQKKVSEPEYKVYSDKLAMRFHPSVEYILDFLPSTSPIVRYVIPDEVLWRLGLDDKEYASIDYSWRMDVPKDRWSVRGIGKEPNTLMYAQQCVLNMLMRAIGRSPFRKIIHIDDQSRNASLALRSSKDGRYDTIDMKDASDRFSNRVARMVFPTKWNDLFQSTRTKMTRLPNGRVVRMEKFAPMGSAICFPAQTLLFTAVCTLARFLVSQGVSAGSYLQHGAIMVSSLRVDEETAVYGDDIICPRSDTLTVISLLEALGFKVNTAKSYLYPSSFRESCGTWAIRGTVVTPIIFKVKGLAAQSLEYVYGMLDLCNRLFVAGYYSTHAFLAGYIPRQFYVEVAFDKDRTVMPYELLSLEPDNTKIRKRLAGVSVGWDPDTTNKTLQRDEALIKMWKVNIDVVSGEAHDRYQYARFLQAPSNTEGAKPPIGDTAQPVVRRVWVPLY